jgi:hypothetical protein
MSFAPRDQVVIPATAGFSTAELVIHPDLSLLKSKQNLISVEIQ